MLDNSNLFSMFKITSSQVAVIQIYPGVIKAIAALLNETKRAAGFLGVPPHHPSKFFKLYLIFWQYQLATFIGITRAE